MTRHEAYQAMLDGKKITHPGYRLTGGFSFIVDNTFARVTGGEAEVHTGLNHEDGYELYKPKGKGDKNDN